MTTTNLYCRLLIEIARRHGVQSIYCSPGSRNTPLLLAIAGNEELHPKVVIDERSAAFMALGEALVSQKPVMIVCTSGTALLNYAPAVAEAFYAGVPLIVVSADRPMEWIDQDDSQTIRQSGVLNHIVKESYDLPVYMADLGKRGEALEWYVQRTLNDAMITAMRCKRGPVHINIQLDNPLGEVTKNRENEAKVINLITGPSDLPNERMKQLAGVAINRKILILCGFMQPDNRLRTAISNISKNLGNVVVMAETVANLGDGGHLNYYLIDGLLTYLDERQLKEIKPDLVITIGGAIISRKVKEWLRKERPLEHWNIGYTHTTVDPLKALTLRIEMAPERFLRQLYIEMRKLNKKRLLSSGNDVGNEIDIYRDLVTRYRAEAISHRNDYLNRIPWCDFKAFQSIADNFPKEANLFLSNGTSVRYDQLLGIRSHATFCNRGVSGIDGCTSTAIGGAIYYGASIPDWDLNKPHTILITGDMSMAYDIGALTWPDIPETFKIIALNNSGGGIFRFIPSTSAIDKETLRTYFCAPPDINIGKLADALRFKHYSADSYESLKEILPLFFNTRGSAILEIITDGEVSAGVLKDYLSRH